MGLATPGLKDLAQAHEGSDSSFTFPPLSWSETEHLLKTSLLQEVLLNHQGNFSSALAHRHAGFLGYSPNSVFTQSAAFPDLPNLAAVFSIPDPRQPPDPRWLSEG